MYFATSKDILFIVIAFAVLWLTIFLSWMLYYLIAILRDARETVHSVKKATDAVESAMNHIKGKFEAAVNIAGLAAEGIKALMSRFSGDEEDGEKKRKK